MDKKTIHSAEITSFIKMKVKKHYLIIFIIATLATSILVLIAVALTPKVERGTLQSIGQVPLIGEEMKDMPVMGDIDYAFKSSYMHRCVYFRANVTDSKIRNYLTEGWAEEDAQRHVDVFTEDNFFAIIPLDDDVVFTYLDDHSIKVYYMPSKQGIVGKGFILLRY